MKATREQLIALEGVGVERGGRWLVRGVDLSIARGEIVTLIGPNGSGKTTTAKVATGVLRPSRGTVIRREGLKVGYVPQKLSIDWTLPLTVERLMTLTGRYSSSEIDAALDEVGARHLRRAAVQELSGGEFQRVLFARAAIRDPDLLVLDEPVQGVDFTGEVALYDLVKRIRDRSRAGILMISHDLHVVMADTDMVLCLNGHICCHGTPDSVVKNPEYLALFGSRAAETLAIYRHDHSHRHLPDGSIETVHNHAPDEDVQGHRHDHHDHDHDDHHHHHHHDHGHGDVHEGHGHAR